MVSAVSSVERWPGAGGITWRTGDLSTRSQKPDLATGGWEGGGQWRGGWNYSQIAGRCRRPSLEYGCFSSRGAAMVVLLGSFFFPGTSGFCKSQLLS